jgi:hypothetical protein
MKDDKEECQEVIKLIEKHFSKEINNTKLDYEEYCFMWNVTLDKKRKK